MRALSIVLCSSLLSSLAAGCGGDDSPPPTDPDASTAPDASTLPTDARPTGTGLLVPVEDVFQITGRGVVAVGVVERGSVSAGDRLDLVGLRPSRQVTVTAVEIDNTPVDEGTVGQRVALFVDGASRDQIERGQVFATVDSIRSITSFAADITLLSFAQGGREDPMPDGYRPQVRFFVSDVSAELDLPIDSLAPGASSRVDAELVLPMAVEAGFEFLLRDGGREIGSGVVIAITE
jgi:elongation factor Tu